MDKKKIVKMAVGKCGKGGIQVIKDKPGDLQNRNNISKAIAGSRVVAPMSTTTAASTKPTIPGSRGSMLKNLVQAGKKVASGAVTNFENKLKAADSARINKEDQMMIENGINPGKYRKGISKAQLGN